MREIEAQAIEKTRLSKQQRATEKRKRRMAERRKNWEVEHEATPLRTEVLPNETADELLDDIEPFNDVEFY